MEVAGPLGTPLGLVKWKGASSRGEAGTSGFLSISDSDRSPCIVGRGESGLLWSLKRGLETALQAMQEKKAFISR